MAEHARNPLRAFAAFQKQSRKGMPALVKRPYADSAAAQYSRPVAMSEIR
jgi:hypothetical protein